MKRLLLVFGFCVLGMAGSAQAMEGVFDRSTEIAKHLDVIKAGTRASVIDSTRTLYWTGISDNQIAAALSARLFGDLQKVDSSDRIGKQYVEWMVKALASTSADYQATIDHVGSEGKSMNIRPFCAAEVSRIGWYKTRNEIMASRKHHQEGDDPQIARMMNLLTADDFSFKHFGADRMNWERILDARLMEEVSRQILLYMDATSYGAPLEQTDTLGLYAKLLGYSGTIRYRETLNLLLKSKANGRVKKQAKQALQNLRS